MLSFLSNPDGLDNQPEIQQLPLPDIEQGGYAINLIVAVRDHAPSRIELIQKEVRDMQTKIVELQHEERLLTELLAVVTP